MGVAHRYAVFAFQANIHLGPRYADLIHGDADSETNRWALPISTLFSPALSLAVETVSNRCHEVYGQIR